MLYSFFLKLYDFSTTISITEVSYENIYNCYLSVYVFKYQKFADFTSHLLALLQKFKAWFECIVLVFGEILQNTVKPV